MSCTWGVQYALFIRKVYECNDSQEALLYINNHLVKMDGIIADNYSPLWRRACGKSCSEAVCGFKAY